MTRYEATTIDGPVDIGMFADDQSARMYAVQKYGTALLDVYPAPFEFETGTSALDPAWLILGLAALLIWMASENKPKRKRGRNVH